MSKIKSFIVDFNNCLNSLFSSFDNLHKELLSGFQLVDNFSDWFSFHTANCKDKNTIHAHIWHLDKIFEDFCSDSEIVIVISDASIKNKVTTLILHIYSGHNIYAKTIYYAINITTTKIEFFAIRYSINQVVQVQNTAHIIVITDAIHAVRQIFNLLSHLY